MIFVFGFLLFISLATAVVYDSSDSSMNETLPVLPVTVTSCDNVNECRTLSAIVYGCIATVFACVWVAVHPNIPCVPNPLDERHKLSVWANNQLWAMQATLMGIILPEMLLFIASQQWLNARVVARDLQKVSGLDDPESNPSRTTMHGFFVNMKGLGDPESNTSRTTTHGFFVNMKGLGKPSWTTTHGFFVNMGGYQFFYGAVPLYPLSRDDVARLVDDGALEPPFKDEIWALSKGGSFTKACALLQTLWFVAQCGARAKEQLPLAQLEVITLSYTLMTMCMYIFWWNKPLSIDRPIPIQLKLKDDPQEALKSDKPFRPPRIDKPFSSTSQHDLTSFRAAYRPLPASTEGVTPSFFSHRTRVPFLGSGLQGKVREWTWESVLVKWVVASLVVAFGCIHLLSWDAHFPAALDRHFWRAGTLLIVGAGGIYFAVVVSSELRQNRLPSRSIQIFWIFYGAVRILMLYVCVKNLSHIPILAYRTVEWTTFLPHV